MALDGELKIDCGRRDPSHHRQNVEAEALGGLISRLYILLSSFLCVPFEWYLIESLSFLHHIQLHKLRQCYVLPESTPRATCLHQRSHLLALHLLKLVTFVGYVEQVRNG